MDIFKGAFVGILIGIVAGFWLYWYFIDDHAQDPAPGEKIIERHISGPGMIRHKDWNFKGPSITCRATATGAAESELEIPKGFIPEAREWLRATDGLQLMLLYQYYGARSHLNYSVLYFRRRGNFAFGGGPVVGPDTVGFQAGAVAWW